jgi:hypothetical protein
MAYNAQGEVVAGIPGFSAYGASRDGGIWRVTRPARGPGAKRSLPSRMCLTDNGHGYLHVSLYADTGRRCTRVVHQLILMAFVGPGPPGYEARHLDGNRRNNSAVNLVWGTQNQNIQDRALHGTTACGERCGTAKLTADKVMAIRRRYAEGGISQRALAAHNGVTHPTIRQIVTRTTWQHI